jgi:hypothetical protein
MRPRLETCDQSVAGWVWCIDAGLDRFEEIVL